ncbi:hypothetical protein PP175_28175 (plasmid) [Aneurinibacillus sp. Ricciae_BoGa-3]|uniref:protease complex subunit PrcB family protein n=1 Tax=Aneurinibacillus sp. Ricciae_BoGa-3 TaxID=3022697 RepID=UPI0023403F25|nr:protease complex subunit PrcB family protein [Aneurinibacillus sp. Ricciae_BoGa-3]WCK57068.1 hypothetical protein PP175_28175 [Aneurinibacillus sp. Ricciae_BoGa-3]
MNIKSNKIAIAIILVLIVGIGCFLYFSKPKPIPKVPPKPVKFEILDSSVKLAPEVEKWMKSNEKKQGFYTVKTSKEVFVLLSGGVRNTTGYGISLNAEKETTDGIELQYEVVAPNKNQKVVSKQTNPHMLLRFETTTKPITGKIVPLAAIQPAVNGKSNSADKGVK